MTRETEMTHAPLLPSAAGWNDAAYFEYEARMIAVAEAEDLARLEGRHPDQLLRGTSWRDILGGAVNVLAGAVIIIGVVWAVIRTAAALL